MRTSLIRTAKSIWILSPGRNLRLPSPDAGGPSLTDEEILAAAPLQRRESQPPYYATVALVTSCNLRCDYCFQNSLVQDGLVKSRIPSRRSSGSSIRRTVDFICQQAGKINAPWVNLTIFGGEPLIAGEANLELLEMLTKRIETRAILVTNGTLLDGTLIERMAQAGLHTVQVSFDGDRRHHDMKRVYAHGGGSFDDIMTNLGKIASQQLNIDWSYRVNLFSPTVNTDELISDLAKVSQIERTMVYFQFIHDTENFVQQGLASASLTKVAIEGYRKALQVGFKVPVPKISDDCPTCSVPQSPSGCCVGPEGLLYSCLETIGKPDLVVGSVYSGYLQNEDIEQRWKQCGYDSYSLHTDAVSANSKVDGWLLDHHYFSGTLSTT